MSDRIVGIDLGTTHTLVAALTPEGPVVLRDERGQALLPSAVAVDDQGVLLVGAAALERLSRAPGSGVQWFKRDMGEPRSWTLGDQTLDATALSALLLKEAKLIAELALGEPIQRAVITVPAYFQEPQRSATREAGELAGLTVERIINEPTAAAMAHGLHDAETERRCVVVDLGGGTLDITLLEIYDGVVEVTASSGDARLGGEDFTDALLRLACKEAGLPEPEPHSLSPVQALLRRDCERAKRALSTQHITRVTLPEPDPESWTTARTLPLSRPLFEGLCEGLLQRVRGCIREALQAGRVDPHAVDELLLVGGATRTPALRSMAQQLFPKARLADGDPDLVVAMGAAVQAGLVARDAAVSDMVVTDVTPHSLGVEITKEGKDRWLPGYFLPILDRNTTLPTRRVHRVSTVHHKQTAVTVRVLQGEHRFANQNRLLGEFVVDELPEHDDPDRRHSIDLAFTHDLNGLLEVEATVVGLDKTFSVLIEQRPGRLGDEARARAVQALARLKTHPRDLLPNRLLLEQAHARHAQLDLQGRELLDRVLLPFEDAIERQQPEAIERAAEALRQGLAHPLLAPMAP